MMSLFLISCCKMLQTALNEIIIIVCLFVDRGQFLRAIFKLLEFHFSHNRFWESCQLGSFTCPFRPVLYICPVPTETIEIVFELLKQCGSIKRIEIVQNHLIQGVLNLVLRLKSAQVGLSSLLSFRRLS